MYQDLTRLEVVDLMDRRVRNSAVTAVTLATSAASWRLPTRTKIDTGRHVVHGNLTSLLARSKVNFSLPMNS